MDDIVDEGDDVLVNGGDFVLSVSCSWSEPPPPLKMSLWSALSEWGVMRPTLALRMLL